MHNEVWGCAETLPSLVLKVRVPCISKLNNEEIIIKDSSAPLKQDTSGLSNIYTGGCAARKTIGVRNRKFVWRAF